MTAIAAWTTYTNSSTSTTTAPHIQVSNCTFAGSGTSTTGSWMTIGPNDKVYIDGNQIKIWDPEDLKLLTCGVYNLVDGSKLCVDFNGNYEIVDHNAKVTYKANTTREFNRYINASDLLEAFIKDLGDLGVRQGEVLSVPIEAFINWLVLRAAEADGEPEPDVPRLSAPKQHRCRSCGRFLSNKMKQLKLDFCNPDHYQKFLQGAM